MKQTTRDNLIYLAVGLVIAALVAFDFFYADSKGKQMWLPSRFAMRLGAYVLVLGYFVGRETRRAGATRRQILACVLASAVIQVGIAYSFQQIFSDRYSLALWAIWVGGAFATVQVMVWAVQKKPRQHQ